MKCRSATECHQRALFTAIGDGNLSGLVDAIYKMDREFEEVEEDELLTL